VARVGGNPFFAEEIVRDLVERDVLCGLRGAYVCDADATTIGVPPTLQAAIGARIDRLGPAAKQALGVAAVIGSRFSVGLLTSLGVEPVLDELVHAELVEQVRVSPHAEYVFRHPLIQTVAYNSQLKSDRAELHRRLASAIRLRHPESVEENAALIAAHLQAAGESRDAYGWHMRAGRWFTGRDIAAARINWERARRIADQLADDDPDRMAMRIAPRTKLCGNSWRGVPTSVEADFEELRALCEAAGDKVALAIGMTGLTTEHLLHGRVRDASRLASEQIGLLEAIGDPKLAFAVGFAAFAKYESGQGGEVLRCANSIVESIEGDPAKKADPGSPLPVALGLRGFARWSLGHSGWKQDLDDAVAIARNGSQGTYASGVAWKYGPAIANGVLLADDHAARELDEALSIVEGLGDGYTLGLVRYVLAGALIYRGGRADCQRALELIDQLRDMVLHRQYLSSETPVLDIYAARVRARHGDIEGAIPPVRKALDDLYDRGQTGWCVSATGVLVDMLLNRGAEADIREAESVAERLADVQVNQNLAVADVELLRVRALLARARGQVVEYRDWVNRYRAMAKSLGFEGHIGIAEAMSSRRVH
jgi:hypothetical protein